MRLWRNIIIGLFSFSGALSLNAQEATRETDRVIENILENTETEEQDNEVIQDLYYFLENPLNINKASEEELQRLYLLNPFQINNLQEYIRKRGNLFSKYELQLIYGFDRDIIQNIEPFITFKSDSRAYDRKFSFDKFFKYSNNQLLLRSQRVVEKAGGYKDLTDDGIDNPGYLGSPYKYYAQYKNRYSDFLRFGVTMEKDYGEEFFKGHNRQGFDYYSGYISLRNTKLFDALILGDYHVRFGQGLTVWSGFSFGKTPYVLDIMKSRSGFNEYSSTNENQFFRGAAVSRTIGSAKLSGFFSKKAIDANLVEGVEERVFTSFQNSGYHRKLSEIEDKNSVLEQVTGGDITFNLNRLKIGLSGIHYSYDAERIHDTVANNIHDFRGTKNMNFGLHYQFQLRDFYFFGEESASPGDGFAFLNGVRANIAKGVSLSMLHRYYQPEYKAVYSGAFSESSSNQNEEGWYLGVKTELVSDLTASIYVDVYRFPWLNFGVDAPSDGYEYLFDLNYSLGDKGRLSARLKNGIKGENFTHEGSFVNPVYEKD
ncbi:MAG: helix-hairpin-helix domain-containing protein, partial [Bacteroidota bacterium]